MLHDFLIRGLTNNVDFYINYLEHKSHLNIHPRKLRHLRRELPSVIYRTWRHLVRFQHATCDRDAVIVVSERGRLVYDACTRVGSDIRVDDDAESFVFILNSCEIEFWKDREG